MKKELIFVLTGDKVITALSALGAVTKTTASILKSESYSSREEYDQLVKNNNDCCRLIEEIAEAVGINVLKPTKKDGLH